MKLKTELQVIRPPMALLVLLIAYGNCQALLKIDIGLGLYERPPNFYLKPTASLQSVSDDDPRFVLKQETSNETVTYVGFWIPTVEWLAHRLNASLRVIRVWKDLGTRQINSSVWSGAIGGLISGEVDVLGPPLLVSGLRGRVLDYAGLCTSDDPVLVSPIPNEENSTLVTIYRPFTVEVWIAAVISLVIAALAVTTVVYVSLRDSTIPNNRGTVTTFGNCLLYLMAILSNQGELFTDLPCRLKPSFRLACAGWCLSALVLTNVYQGTLTSHLTDRRLEKPPEHPSELVDQGKYEYLVLATGVAREMLLEAKEGPEKKIGNYLRKRPKNFVASTEEGFQKVTSGCCVYGDTKSYLEFLEKVDFETSKSCRVYIGKPFRGVIGYGGPVFTKNHRYREIFHRKLLELNQHGLEKHWRKNFLGHQSTCQERVNQMISMRKNKKTKSLSIRDMSGSFPLLAFGCLLSLLSFVVEQHRACYFFLF